MLCEIEFLPVGEGSRAGDAIVVRYGEVNNYELMVVDGGTTDAGEALVAHLRAHFGQKVTLAHVVLTHSDIDHASGLREVLRQIPVRNLWLHIPWDHSGEALHLFQYKQWTAQTLGAAISKEYDIIKEIVDLAQKQGTQIFYPFEGSAIGPFAVLSPSRYAYVHLMPQFDKTPAPDQAAIEAANMWLGKAAGAQGGLLSQLFEKAAAKVSNWLPETWILERLRGDGQTSASNETSVVLYANLGDSRILLTGDAGRNALTWSANFADQMRYPLQQFNLVQIPHHGSRRNVGPSILNRLLGPVQPEHSAPRFIAAVSAPKDDDQHPRKIVLNAFKRRGGDVYATQGKTLLHYGGFPTRNGYSNAVALQFSTNVEAYD